MGSRKRTTDKATPKPAADAPAASPPPATPRRWLDFIPENWDAINSRQAYYLVGRVWRQYHFFCQQWVPCSYRPEVSDKRLNERLHDLQLPLVVGMISLDLCTQGFDRTTGSEFRLALRYAANRLSPKYGLGIRTRVDALLDRHFPICKSGEPLPWKRELETANDVLQQAAVKGISEQERTRLAKTHYDTLMKKFVIRPFATLSEELLRGAKEAAANLFQVGEQLEKGFCPRHLFTHVRSTRLIPKTQRKWTDVVLADRWLSPAEAPPSRGWPANLKGTLESAGLYSHELQSLLAGYETAVSGSQASVPVPMEQLHELIMAALASDNKPQAASPAPSGPVEKEEERVSPSMGLTLTRRRLDKRKNFTYGLLRTGDETTSKEPEPQAGDILWMLFEAERDTGACRLEWERVKGYLDDRARGNKKKKGASARHRMAIGRLNSFLKNFNLTVSKKDSEDDSEQQYLEVSKIDSSS